MRDNKPKKIALIVLVVAIVGLTIAFAALSSNLTISGNAKLDPINWDIYFDNISNVDLSGEAAIVDNPEIDSNDKTKITNFNVTLNKPGDKATFTVDLVNESDIAAVISGIDTPTIDYEFIVFKAMYTGTNTEVALDNEIAAKTDAGASRTNITISIYYSKEKVASEDLSRIPDDGLTIGLNYGLTFKQSDKTADMTTTTKSINECTEFTKKDTYEVGDVIAFCNTNTGKSEDFYVIKDNGDTVTALAKYNLMVGSKVVYDDSFENVLSNTTLTSSDKNYGLQSKDTTFELTSEGMPTSTTLYGFIAFANKKENNKTADGDYLGYWTNAENKELNKPLEAYGTSYPADVYDSNSILYDHVQNYQTYFTSTLNKTTAKMRLITYNELVELGCSTDDGTCTKDFVYKNLSYWSASARAYSYVWGVSAIGGFDSYYFWYGDGLGARPVITISKSDI